MGKKSVLWLTAAMAVFCLIAAPAGGLNHSPSPPAPAEPEGVQQLDPIEVTAIRIAPPQRPIFLPLPEVSTATLLPPDDIGIHLLPDMPAPILSAPPRLLRDETATRLGGQTGVRYLDTVRPPYPRRAREMGWEGTVVLRVEVKPDGTVGEVALRRTSGHATLDEVALTAVKGWRFAPLTDGAFAMSAVVDVPVRFDLRDVLVGEQ